MYGMILVGVLALYLWSVFTKPLEPDQPVVDLEWEAPMLGDYCDL